MKIGQYMIDVEDGIARFTGVDTPASPVVGQTEDLLAIRVPGHTWYQPGTTGKMMYAPVSYQVYRRVGERVYEQVMEWSLSDGRESK